MLIFHPAFHLLYYILPTDPPKRALGESRILWWSFVNTGFYHKRVLLYLLKENCILNGSPIHPVLTLLSRCDMPVKSWRQRPAGYKWSFKNTSSFLTQEHWLKKGAQTAVTTDHMHYLTSASYFKVYFISVPWVNIHLYVMCCLATQWRRKTRVGDYWCLQNQSIRVSKQYWYFLKCLGVCQKQGGRWKYPIKPTPEW